MAVTMDWTLVVRRADKLVEWMGMCSVALMVVMKADMLVVCWVVKLVECLVFYLVVVFLS